MEQLTEKNTAGFADRAASAFTADFLNAAFCLQWFLDRYYPDGYRCPDCGAPVSDRCLDSFLALRRFTCSECGGQPRATKRTILQDSGFNPSELYLLCLLISYGLDDSAIARTLSVSAATVNTWRAKIAALDEVGQP